MTYTEEMTTSEILLRLASMRNELLQAVNDIEKISKNICYKAEQTENNSEKPNNCEVKNYCDDCLYTDTCDSKAFFYACTSKATISKMEQVEDEPQTCDNCKLKGSTKWCNNQEVCRAYKPKTEPQTEPLHTCSVNGRPYSECSSCEHFKCTADEPQTDCAWR